MTPLSVEQIYATIISQVETQIGQTVPILPIAFIRVLAKSIAGVTVLVYKYTGWIFLQLYVATASAEPTTVGGNTITPLTEWGRLVGAGDPVPGVAAELTVDVTVVNLTGDPIPAGTSLTNDANGVVYLTTTTVLKDAATKSLTMEAVSDQAGGSGAGAIGNLENGTIVSFTSPIADVNRDAVVTSTVTSGEDEEPTAQYRQRIIDRFQKPPQGGALSDYEIWAEEAPGIINAYPYTGAIPGTVEVYCEADPVSSGSPDGIPTQPQLDAALDSINQAGRRPANALAFTYPITRKPFQIEILSLAGPDIPATQQAIEDGMDTLFATYEPYIGGNTVTPRDRITQSEVAGEVFAIAQGNGATVSTVILKTQVQAQTSYNQSISAASDDADEFATVVNLANTSLSFFQGNTVGIRFTGVTVPADATIVSAVIRFTSSSVKNPYSVITIQGEASANATTFNVTPSNLTDRPRTVNSVQWVPEAWAVDEQKTISVATLVEDVLTVPGWASGNAMAFLFDSAVGSDRDAWAYDGSVPKAARLEITFQSPTVGYASQNVTTLQTGQKAKVDSVSFS
jgi:uncharacterized phage protein gp47/JayE